MRLTQELNKQRPFTTDDIRNLTDSARQALVSICKSLGQLQRIAPVILPSGSNVAFAPSRCQFLLEQLIDISLSGPADDPVALRLAYRAVCARDFFHSDSRYSFVLDRCLEYLDTVLGLTDNVVGESLSACNLSSGNPLSPLSSTSSDTAALISDLFSTSSMSDEDSAPYMDALRSYIATAIEQLEEELSLSSTFSSPLGEVGKGLPVVHCPHLVAQLNTLSLIFESSYLLHDEFRMRAIPLFDILRRHVLRHLTEISRTLTAQPDSSFATRHSSLLSSFSRLLQSDLEGAPSAYNSLLATFAVQGLDALDRIESLETSELQYASVLAASTLKYECERQNYETYNPFER